MKTALIISLLVLFISVSPHCFSAQAPKNIGVSFDGKSIDAADTLVSDKWHTISAKYKCPGDINSYLVVCKGSSQLFGFYIGYNLERNELAVVKHGYWNATEGIGFPGEKGKIVENDQGYLDCENTRIEKTSAEITIHYRVMFKKNVLMGVYNVFMYSQDKDNYDGFDNVGTITIDKDSSVTRTDMPKQWKSSLKPIGKQVSSLTLANKGKALYLLVIPKNAKETEQKAASDINYYFKLISGTGFSIVSEDKLPVKKHSYISIGRTKLLAKSKSSWKNTNLAVEGYALDVIDKNVYLYGGSGRGLMNGIYSMLEEDIGCRWYSTSSMDTPKMKKLSVSLVPRKYLPLLELRDPFIHKMHDTNWSLRNKTNTPHARIPLSWGGSIRYQNMGHTFALYFPTERYFAEHPEYYSLVNGVRQPSQLCNTNENVIRLSIEKTCEIFRENPEVTITAIGPNDGRGFCDCPNCKKLDDENGGRSGSFFYLVNRIAEGVKKEFPENHLISLAYLDYANPPTHFKVDPYIIIQLCTDSHAWKYQFCYVWESQDFQKMLKAWHAVNAKIYLWDYTTDYIHYLTPMANWQVVAGNTRYNIKNGVDGIMYESESNDSDELRGWVWAKQMWNPNLDTKKLMKDFIYGYYKEAATPIWKFNMMVWDFWEKYHAMPHKCGEPSENPLLNNYMCSYNPDGPMFTPEFMIKMRKYFTESEKLAKSDDILARVKKAKVSLLYLELAQNLGYFTEMSKFVPGKSIDRPLAEKAIYKQYLDEFNGLVKKNELSDCGIPTTFEKITTKWQSCIDTDSSSIPKIGLSNAWFFMPDPKDAGQKEEWQKVQARYGGINGITPDGCTVIRSDKDRGWESQGFPGYTGVGWYYQTLSLPKEFVNAKHLYMLFSGVDEEGWVYINGDLVYERSIASTKQTPVQLWNQPFLFDAKPFLKTDSTNQIAVRVYNSADMGGIYQPVILYAVDKEYSASELQP